MASSSNTPPPTSHIQLLINDKVVFESNNLEKKLSNTSNNADSTIYTRALFFQPKGHQFPIEGKQYTYKNKHLPNNSKSKLGYFQSFNFENTSEEMYREVYDVLMLNLIFDNTQFHLSTNRLENNLIPTTLSEYFENKTINSQFIGLLHNIFNYHKNDNKLPQYTYSMKGGKISRKTKKNSKYKKSKHNKKKYNRTKK